MIVCAITGHTLTEEEQIRLVVTPEGNVIPDITADLPATGIWVRCTHETIRSLDHSALFGDAILDIDALQAQIEALLRRHCLDLLAMSRKTGLLVSGYEKVRTLLAAKQAALVIRANDSAYSAKEQLYIKDAVPVVTLFNSAELSTINSHQHVVHMALKSGKLTTKLHSAIKRLTYYMNSYVII